MQKSTLVFVFSANGSHQLLLAMKKRGLGVGKFNGAGGKTSEGETVERCAVREVHEEVGLKIPEEKLVHRGVIEFNFPSKPQWNNECFLFVVHESFAGEFGEPVESEEMKPQWFNVDSLPFHSMWADDAIWLPRVLKGEFVKYRFWHDAETSEILRYEAIQ